MSTIAPGPKRQKSPTMQIADAREPVRVMLVDDSIVARSILERIIEQGAEFVVVASVPTAADALDSIVQAAPDIVVLDINMPGMCGIKALPLILAKAAHVRVIILSANCEEGGPAAIEALANGAADTLIKPGRGTFTGNFGERLLDRLRVLAKSPQVSLSPASAVILSTAAGELTVRPHQIDAIGIGASTGGIMAINSFLGALPKKLDCPIFITQHLPGTFIPFFADQIRRLVKRKVSVATDGMVVASNHIYLAPGHGHISLSGQPGSVKISIDQCPVASGATPSVDPMLSSLANVYGSGGCGVMLSGMGKDGLDGARALRAAGGLVLAQSLESCVVWGMPGAVVSEGIAAYIQDPAALAVIVSHAAGLQTAGLKAAGLKAAGLQVGNV